MCMITVLLCTFYWNAFDVNAVSNGQKYYVLSSLVLDTVMGSDVKFCGIEMAKTYRLVFYQTLLPIQ